VLITEATRRLLTKDHGGLIARGRVPLKGKAEHVQLYAPMAIPVLDLPRRERRSNLA
jgi:hypothetical protein